jgi:cation transport regulator ChaC
MPLVFQYGSNCDADRLNGPQRLAGHAEPRGRAYSVDDFDILFDVFSQTNDCAAADIVPIPGLMVWGVLYEIPDDFIRGRRTDGQKTLAQIEGQKYEERTIRVCDRNGKESDAITFVAMEAEVTVGLWTSADYVGHIVRGLRAHEVPEDYVTHVIDVAVQVNTITGQHDAQALDHARLIKMLRRSTQEP